ncbi:MAG: haloacid dehalogenase [Dehalococcoidia bacterium]
MDRLETIAEHARAALEAKHSHRERGLQVQREVIRTAANSIRAVHRGEFDRARDLLDGAADALSRINAALQPHPDLRHAGWLHDAEKEYAEAELTLAFLSGRPIPGPDDLAVGVAPYLNGLGETVGELRRAVLDILRHGELGQSEALLEAMDAIYGLLVTIDFPDALTGGLRRTTDNARGILERTRGDLTVAIRQKMLEDKLAAVERRPDRLGNG